MPTIQQDQVRFPLTFDSGDLFSIVTHRNVGEITYFTYRIPLVYDVNVEIDPSLTMQVRIVTEQKRNPIKNITKKSLLNGTALKDIRAQPANNFFTQNLSTSHVTIPYVDLVKKNLTYDIEIPITDIKNQIVFQNVLLDKDGVFYIGSSITINHDDKLTLYDVAKNNFDVRAGFLDDNTIAVSAVSFDPLIGKFNFYVKNETQIDSKTSYYELISSSDLDGKGIATINFNIEKGQKLIFAVTPNTKFKNTSMSQMRETEVGSRYNHIILPFYMSGISDVFLRFTISSVSSSVKRVLLYRQIYGSNKREYIAYADNKGTDIIIDDPQRLTKYDAVYTLDYIDKDSVLKTSPSQVFVPSLKLNTLANIAASVVDQKFYEDRVTTKFDIKVNYNNTTAFDQIVSDLKKIGLDNLFDEDLKKMTNNIKPLIRVLASRINLNDGTQEELGVIEPGEVSYVNSTRDSYQYLFEIAIRSAPELMENLASSQRVLSNISRDSRDIVDTATKTIATRFKQGQTSFTAKFLSKASLSDSLLKYGNAASGIDLGYYSGRTGIFSSISIANLEKSILISDVTYQKINTGGILTWKFTGNPIYFNVTAGGITRKAAITSNRTCVFYLDSSIKGQVTIRSVSKSTAQNAYASTEIS
jgi:hypothetical protein